MNGPRANIRGTDGSLPYQGQKTNTCEEYAINVIRKSVNPTLRPQVSKGLRYDTFLNRTKFSQVSFPSKEQLKGFTIHKVINVACAWPRRCAAKRPVRI